jgi:hypothetical protein
LAAHRRAAIQQNTPNAMAEYTRLMMVALVGLIPIAFSCRA